MSAEAAGIAWSRPADAASHVEGLPFGSVPFLSYRGRLSRSVAIAFLFGALAAVDIATSPDLSFLVFYLLPVLLAAWFLGRREGLLVSFASVAVWALDDALTRPLRSGPGIPAWNRAGQLAFFVFLAWLAGTLKTVLEKEVRARSEHLERDLALAREVQASLLPPPHLEAGRFVAEARCHQAWGLGGDAYDLGSLGDGRLYVAVADVSGKGMAAALLMSSFLASLRLLLPSHAGRLDVLAGRLSERLHASFGAPRFVTAFVGVVEDGGLRYVNAGHTPGFVLGPRAPSGDALGSTGTVLGLLPGATFREGRVPFPPGSLLVLFTDGLTECVNAAGEEFGEERALAAAASAGGTPSSVVEALLAAASSHAAGEPFGDDVTIVCLRREAGEGAPS